MTKKKSTENPMVILKDSFMEAPLMAKIYPLIHPSACIHLGAKIHPTVVIGPYCIIEECEIGENSRIQTSTIVKNGSVIGKNVIIREFCLIGSGSFVFVRDNFHNLKQTTPVGNAVIEDDVELFPYVNVDKGAFDKTLIKKGTKIDHYCHIGHDSTIGEHCVITANTVFCGESSIGDYSFVGVGVVVKPRIKIGSNCLIGMGSIVTKNIKDDWLAYGNPAKMIRKNERGPLSG